MTCSGSSGSPDPAGGHMVAGLYLAQWCQSTRQRWPKHTLRRSSWAQCVCPGFAQAHASPGRGLFGPIDHADLTCTLRPTATFFMSSYLRYTPCFFFSPFLLVFFLNVQHLFFILSYDFNLFTLLMCSFTTFTL